MRLEARDIEALPLLAALVDADGRTMTATPEWRGACPGTLAYRVGRAGLLVAPDHPNPSLDDLMRRLLHELRATATALDGEAAQRTAVLAAGLELVGGRPLAPEQGRAEQVVPLALAAIRARAPALAVRAAGPVPRSPIPSPAAIALAVTQLAVNARQHEAASEVSLRIAAGPTFWVEWPAPLSAPSPITAHRHALGRERWGWGCVQMVADAIGGTALPPAPTRPGLRGACVGLGAAGLALPVACVRDGRVERSTHTWDQGPRMPGFGQAVSGALARLIEAASTRPGEIVYQGLYRARASGDRAWAALAPESGPARALDLLRGLRHERDLWDAPEPHATRVAALATLLRVALGEPWPSVPPAAFAEGLAAACAGLGLPAPAPVDTVCPPDPQVAAYLLAELRGRLVCQGEDVLVIPGVREHPLALALGVDREGWVRINQ